VFNRYLLFGAVEVGAARLDHEEAEIDGAIAEFERGADPDGGAGAVDS